jgi:RHS repeat-associated protein
VEEPGLWQLTGGPAKNKTLGQRAARQLEEKREGIAMLSPNQLISARGTPSCARTSLIFLAGAVAFTLLTSSPVSAETVTYYYTNQQGTPLATADSSGTVTSTTDYRPFGKQAMGNAAPGPGYTGHVNDVDAGLIYMQARYYDAATGIFLSPDPISPATGNVYTFSRYAYANNNPISNTDPTGLYVCKATKGVEGECQKIADAIQELKKAANWYADGSKEQQDIQQIIEFYGEEKENNGVVVRFKKIENASAYTQARHAIFGSRGKATITFDLDGITELAVTVAHEGRHGVRGTDKRIPRTTTRDLEFRDEQLAFTSQGYVNQGLGLDSPYLIWKKGDTQLNQERIDFYSNNSADWWCANGGSCK